MSGKSKLFAIATSSLVLGAATQVDAKALLDLKPMGQTSLVKQGWNDNSDNGEQSCGEGSCGGGGTQDSASEGGCGQGSCGSGGTDDDKESLKNRWGYKWDDENSKGGCSGGRCPPR